MKVKSIKIKGFRGFNVEQEIVLDAGVVLVYGLNGSGKSSLAEAFEWLFFDDISRRRLSPCPGEYSTGVYLKNLSYAEVDRPSVEATIYDDSGAELRIRKELISEKESASFVDGVEVENFEAALPGLKAHHSPVLAQIEISALVNTEQKDRWEQLSRILGQEELTLLRTQIMELRSNKKDEEYKKDEQLFHGICREIETVHLLPDFSDAFNKQDLETLQEVVKDNLIDKALNPGGALIDRVKATISRVTGTELGRRIADLTAVEQKETERLQASLSDSFAKLIEQAQKAAQGKFSQEEALFFSEGLKIAHPPQCPFCVQETLTEVRTEEIKSALEKDKESIESKQSFDRQSHDNEIVFRSLSSSLANCIPDTRELKVISQKLGEANLNELSGKVKQLTENIEGKLQELPSRLKLLYDGLCSAITEKYFHKKDTDITLAQSTIEKYIEDMGGVLSEVNTDWQELRDTILVQFPTVTADQQESEMKKWMLVERAILFLKNKVRFLRKYHLIEVVTEEIRKKLEVFEKAELESLLIQHSEEIKTYYEKLNPGESIGFGKIEVRDGTRRQAKLIATREDGKEINPVTIFSEAHINSLSLSIYFPQRVDRNPLWKTILLDDPVQSMDNNHARSLIEILKEKAADKQIVVLTHSKEFADDIASNFLYNDLLHYEFYDADDSGPKIKINHGKTMGCLAFVEGNRNGSAMEREQAANALRKAIEAAIGEILIKNARTVSQVRGFSKEGFPKLFDQLERVQAINKTDIGTLRGLLDEGQQGSHIWSIRDSTPGGLAQGIKNVQLIYSKYIVTT